jgi:hypothetical protein
MYEAYYIHGGAADHVVIIDHERQNATSLVVDWEVLRDFQAATPEWGNWHGEDVDFLDKPIEDWEEEDLDAAFGGEVIARRSDEQPPTIYDQETWESRQEFYNR